MGKEISLITLDVKCKLLAFGGVGEETVRAELSEEAFAVGHRGGRSPRRVDVMAFVGHGLDGGAFPEQAAVLA